MHLCVLWPAMSILKPLILISYHLWMKFKPIFYQLLTILSSAFTFYYCSFVKCVYWFYTLLKKNNLKVSPAKTFKIFVIVI